MIAVARVFGAPAIHLILEAIEVFGVRKYLTVWRQYEHGPLGAAVREVLEDEFKHEDAVVTAESDRQISPQRVRDIFLGLNDGLVEILGAVSGFFGAFARRHHRAGGRSHGRGGRRALDGGRAPTWPPARRRRCAAPTCGGAASWARPRRPTRPATPRSAPASGSG